jgi:alkylhydroperoxidase family enzyme
VAGRGALLHPRRAGGAGPDRAITRITDGVPDDVYRRATDHFDDTELAQLIAVILTINTWNRIAVTTTRTPGTVERR